MLRKEERTKTRKEAIEFMKLSGAERISGNETKLKTIEFVFN